jgi:hypothetical protein
MRLTFARPSLPKKSSAVFFVKPMVNIFMR